MVTWNSQDQGDHSEKSVYVWLVLTLYMSEGCDFIRDGFYVEWGLKQT
jgi:hypothetical protein